MSDEGVRVGPVAIPRRKWTERHWSHFGFGALLSILFLTFIDITIISAVLSNVQSQLHSGVTDLQWMVGGYALAFASLMLICGSLADNFGRKKLMLIGVGVFCVGSVVCAIATSSAELIVGRVVMGIGAAASEPGTLSMIRQIYPNSRERARALGAWAAVSGLALATGPVLGSVLVGLWSWRAVFWFNLVFGVVAFAVATIALPESADPTRRRQDYLGFALGAFTLGAATYATIAGESTGYFTAWVLILWGASVFSLVAFVLVERKTVNPMINLEFFRRPAFAGSIVVAFTSYFSILSLFFFVALYLEVVGSAGAYELAQDFLPLLVAMLTASLLTGRWVAAQGSRVPMIVGCLVAALGVALTDALITPSAGLATVGWTMGIAGVGFGILVVPVTSTALNSLPAANSGMAASITNTSRELGAVAGIAILGSIVNGQLTVHLTQRLAEIGVPLAYRTQVIIAVTTGSFGAQEKALGTHNAVAVQVIVNKVIAAAFQSFTHGLNLALGTSFVLLIVSAVVAYVTGASEHS